MNIDLPRNEQVSVACTCGFDTFPSACDWALDTPPGHLPYCGQSDARLAVLAALLGCDCGNPLTGARTAMAVFPAAFPVLPLYDPARYNSVNLGAHVRVEMLESFAALLQDHYADCYADFGSYVDEMIRRCFVMINRLEVS